MGEVIQFPRKPAPAEPGRIVVLRLTPADVAVLNALIDAHEARAAASPEASAPAPAVQVRAMRAECARVEREMVGTALRVMLALAVSVGCAVAALGGLS